MSWQQVTFPKSSGSIAFGAVWLVGVAFALITFRLAISGKLWALGIPGWLITLICLVGIWQWIWIMPLLGLARGRNNMTVYNGLLRGGISFSGLQLSVFLLLYLMLRKFNLQ
ncbi:MAG: hypothetical protein JO065_17070 [Acidobacteria bacterium]|nr:hypothetical protein [Acidobacteriota bacterium]